MPHIRADLAPCLSLSILGSRRQVLGEAKPYSICGSLPLVRNMQRGGFDVQMTGFGLMSTYHVMATRNRTRPPAPPRLSRSVADRLEYPSHGF